MKTAELRALTSMRGIAAWFVVLYHIRKSIDGLGETGLAVLGKGYLAVDFFFLLSGFVIWLSWGSRLREGDLGTIRAFLGKRIARIWPLHLFMLACAAALAGLLATLGKANPQAFPFAQLPLHAVLIQNWGFTDRLSWNVPSWSISAELAAYLLFPLLALSIDWRRVPSILVVVAIVAACGLLHAVMARGGAEILDLQIPRFGLLRCLTEFAAGTALCALWLRWRDEPAIPAAFAILAAACLAMSWLLGLPETIAVPLMFAALLLALALTAEMARNPLSNRVLHYLGEISYATYLGHYMLWTVFKLALVTDARAVPLPLIGLYLLLVLLSSTLLYHLVERPAQRLINDWRWPRRQRVASQPD